MFFCQLIDDPKFTIRCSLMKGIDHLNGLVFICSVGDPRIQAAKVIWVESDATSWVKNTRKVSKGEPALEIIVEKDDF